MAVLTECGSVNIACLYASALTMFRPIGVCRLYCPVPSTVLTEQRGHILEVGLAPIVGVFRKHQAHEHPYRLLATYYFCQILRYLSAIQHFFGASLVSPTRLRTVPSFVIPRTRKMLLQLGTVLRRVGWCSHEAGSVATERKHHGAKPFTPTPLSYLNSFICRPCE